MDSQSAARATRAIIINSASVISTVTVKGRGSTLRNGCLQTLQLLVLRFTGQFCLLSIKAMTTCGGNVGSQFFG